MGVRLFDVFVIDSDSFGRPKIVVGILALFEDYGFVLASFYLYRKLGEVIAMGFVLALQPIPLLIQSSE